MKYPSEPRSRLVLAGLCFSVLGCDAVLGIDATPFVGARRDGSTTVDPTGDGAAASADAAEASVAPIEASVVDMPDASGTDVTVADASGGESGNETGGTESADSGNSPVSLQDCVLLMHMDEPSWSASTTVIDSSGQGNNGTLVGPAQTVAGGKFGRAAQFGGSGYVTVPDSNSLHPTTALTYAAWIYPTGFTSDSLYPGIIGKRQAYADDSAFAMFLWTGNALWADIESNRSSSTGTIPNNLGWYHVAVVYDGTLVDSTKRVSIYINGAFDSASTAGTSMSPHVEALDIGYLAQGSYTDPNAFFVGLIDEVAIWNRALSAAEIAALYSATGPL